MAVGLESVGSRHDHPHVVCDVPAFPYLSITAALPSSYVGGPSSHPGLRGQAAWEAHFFFQSSCLLENCREGLAVAEMGGPQAAGLGDVLTEGDLRVVAVSLLQALIF